MSAVEPRSTEADAPISGDHSRFMLRLVAGCVLLVGLAFLQSPGLLVADTKFDLAVDPAGFLRRALHLWDGEGAFGQLQNQAYGYLWPMGPFFLVGSLLDLPGWVVQRLWTAVVLGTAFVGTARVSRALGVRSDAAALVAGFAYALSPRMLSTLGPISIEAWPSAVAPWVLLFLVRGSREGSPRRAALGAALAVAMVGGVNAAATSAVLPLGVVWLLTREPGPRRRALLLWWPVFTVLATAWWLVPLFVMGAYSPPFLDFIESASVTTFPTNLADALRGTSAWVPYVDPSWRGGSDLVRDGVTAVNAGALLVLGLAGILVGGGRHRQFLLLSVLVGLVLVTMGHLGEAEGWFAQPLREQLDAALAPLRNVHKFDPVVRLPMTLGLALLLDAAARVRAAEGLRLAPRTVFVGLAVVALVGATVPAWSARLAPSRPVLETPRYWTQAADWLAEQRDLGVAGVALLAPGSGFGDYLWGAPRDEPLQVLADSPWAVRNAIPLAPAAGIRMLDAIEQRLAEGRPSRGLAPYLARAGVSYLVVRNDLRPGPDVPDPALVHQAIDGSPGLLLRKRFGPPVGGEANLETDAGRLVINGGWQDERRAIEVYYVRGGEHPAVTTDGLPTVIGGPEDLLGLADALLLGGAPTRLAVDVPDAEVAGGPVDPGAPVVLTDGLLDRERFFGRVHDGYSSVRTPGDERSSGNPTTDYAPGPPGADVSRWRTTARLDGATTIRTSSSMSDATALGGTRLGELSYAALDDDPASQWVSGFGESDAWWRVDLRAARDVDEVTVTLGDGGTGRAEVRVRTEAGVSDPVAMEAGDTRALAVLAGATSWVRVEESSGTPRQLALADVEVPGVEVRRALVLPVVPPAWGAPAAILLRPLADARTGCVVVARRTPCRQSEVGSPEEPGTAERVVTLPEAAAYRPRLVGLPRAGAALDVALQARQPISATGSSTGVPDPRGGALAAVDGDPATSWTPSWADPDPRLGLGWLGRRTVTGLGLAVDADSPVKEPRVVRVTWPGGEAEVELDDEGHADLPEPVRTDQVTLSFPEVENASSVGSEGTAAALPVGVGEVVLDGVPVAPVRVSTQVRSWGCGSGPDVRVSDALAQTAVVASAAQLYRVEPVRLRWCGERLVSLGAGETRVSMAPGELATTSWLRLRAPGPEARTALGERLVVPADLTAPDAVTRQAGPLWPFGAGSVLVVRQNQNAGWEAGVGGRRLEPVVVDGWQQGWVAPADGDLDGTTVTARYAADTPYRAGLLAGLAVLVGLVAAALLAPLQRRGLVTGPPALDQRDLSGLALVAVALLAAGVLTGTVGVVVSAVGAGCGTALRRVPDVGAWLAGLPVFVATFAYLVRPWGSSEGWAGDWAWPGYLVVLSLGAATGLAVERWRPRSRSRWNGSSTQR